MTDVVFYLYKSLTKDGVSMKRMLYLTTVAILLLILLGCQSNTDVQVAATTAPVYEFTMRICHGTDIRVGLIVTENISCLHDYSLQTNQMRLIENAQIIILSGAGLEEFLHGISTSATIIDTSASIELLCGKSTHEHTKEDQGHNHEYDPHIWLSPANAIQMAQNICAGLMNAYPQYTEQFSANLETLLAELSMLETYGITQLSNLSTRNLITFHDGFAYFAKAFDLNILHAIEEESGSEASAAELIEICNIVDSCDLPAIFTEQNGSVSAADIIAAETDAVVYKLDMAMSGNGYFKAMYSNIDTIKEAMG